jgi:hypothetical protein
MSSALMFWCMFITKMAVTALFMSLTTIIAARLGTTAGALVATLPVSAGPVYVVLAVDHDSAFISKSALSSLALNAATAIFITVYVLAQQRSLWFSVSYASPRRRSCHRSTAGKRHFRPCRLWSSPAYTASHRSAVWIRRCPPCRSWRLRMLERCHLCHAALSPNSRLKIISIEVPKAMGA